MRSGRDRGVLQIYFAVSGLLAAAGMIIASALFHWGNNGVKLVGDVPSGLPHLTLPDVAWSEIPSVVPVAFSCFIVILAQGAATSRAYALRYDDPFDEDVDLVGLSLANVAAGCSGTFVVNGSPTKTAMVDTAGGRSQMSQLTTVAIVLLVLLFFTRPLSYLPSAVLAAIVFLIGVKLIDYRGLAEIGKRSREEFILRLLPRRSSCWSASSKAFSRRWSSRCSIMCGTAIDPPRRSFSTIRSNTGGWKKQPPAR